MENMELGQIAEELFWGFQIDKSGMIEALQEGNFGEVIAIWAEAVWRTLGHPMEYAKECLTAFIILGIGAAMIKQLSLFFKDSQIQKVGFWIIYLMLARQLLGLYYSGESIVLECLERLIDFGNIFVPVFAGVLTLAAGSITGAGYITTLLGIIYLIEQFLVNVMVPLTEGYMLLSLLGALWQKDRVEKLMELMEKGLSWGFKAIFLATTGFGVLQSMILPYVDRTKMGVVKKVVEIIPGAGGLAGVTLELINGSAVLLKNGIGVIGILLLLVVAAAPLLKLGLICLIMKLASVVYGLFDDRQMSWCADKLSFAEGYLWKITASGMLLFLLWIVLAVYTTNQRLIM